MFFQQDSSLSSNGICSHQHNGREKEGEREREREGERKGVDEREGVGGREVVGERRSGSVSRIKSGRERGSIPGGIQRNRLVLGSCNSREKFLFRDTGLAVTT